MHTEPDPSLNRHSVRLLISLALLVMTLFPLAGCSSQEDEAPPIETATVSDETIRVSIAGIITPKETYSQYSELLDYISRRTGHPTVLEQTGTYMGVNDSLAREEIDVAFMCSGGYEEASHHIGIKPLVAPVINGEAVYHAYIIVRSNSGITSFDQLRGRRFAFTDPLSLTGTIYPSSRAIESGNSPDEFFSDFIFTYNHDNSIKALQENVVDGASVDSIIFDSLKANHPESVEGLSIIETSEPFGSPPIVTRRGMAEEERRQLLDVLTGMDEDPWGKEILTAMGIDRFIAVDNSHYDAVRKLEGKLSSGPGGSG